MMTITLQEDAMYTRYTYTEHDVATLPVDWEASVNWDEFEPACVEAGFDPEDEEIGAGYLTEPWNGHGGGSLVISSMTVAGHPFVIFGLREPTPQEILARVADERRISPGREHVVVYWAEGGDYSVTSGPGGFDDYRLWCYRRELTVGQSGIAYIVRVDGTVEKL